MIYFFDLQVLLNVCVFFFFCFHLFVCIPYLVYLMFSSCLVLVRDMNRCWLVFFLGNSPPTMSTFILFVLISIRGFLKLPYFVTFLSCCRMHLSSSYSILCSFISFIYVLLFFFYTVGSFSLYAVSNTDSSGQIISRCIVVSRLHVNLAGFCFLLWSHCAFLHGGAWHDSYDCTLVKVFDPFS